MFNSKLSRDVTVHKQLFSEIDMQFANQFNTSTSIVHACHKIDILRTRSLCMTIERCRACTTIS